VQGQQRHEQMGQEISQKQSDQSDADESTYLANRPARSPGKIEELIQGEIDEHPKEIGDSYGRSEIHGKGCRKIEPAGNIDQGGQTGKNKVERELSQ